MVSAAHCGAVVSEILGTNPTADHCVCHDSHCGHELHNVTAVPRSTQLSNPMASQLPFGLNRPIIIINGDAVCVDGRRIHSPFRWLGLRVGFHLALGLHP